MERTIYIDVLLLINFCADYVLLYLTAKFMHLKMKFARLFFSSFIGAVYGGLCEIYIKNAFLKLLSVILVIFFMARIAFNLNNGTKLLKAGIFSVVMSVVLSGIIELSINIFSLFIEYQKAHSLFSNPYVLVVAFIFMCFGIIKIFSLFFSDSTKKTAEIHIKKDNKIVKLTLLCDSGNLLRDPYCNLPVIVVKHNSIKDITGDNIYNSDLQIRFIPAKTASGSVVFPTFKADSVYVVSEKKKECELSVVVAVDTVSQSDYADTDGVILSSLV